MIALALIAAALVGCGALVHEAFFAGLVVLAILIVAGLAYSYAYYARQRLSFHEHHVQAEHGVLLKSRFHARYSNVKKVQLTRYPGCDQGALQIFVAGEHRIVQQKQGQPGQAPGGGQTGATLPYSFTTQFITGIGEKQHLVDDLLCGRVDATPDATAVEALGLLCESKRAVGNTVLKLILFSLVCVPLAPLLPLTIPIAVVEIRRWRYRVEAGRVVVSWGILFHSQASVLFDRIDTLRHGQGLVNKMFGNGNVTLMTAGSSQPDLVLANTPDYEAVYAEIRRHYGKNA